MFRKRDLLIYLTLYECKVELDNPKITSLILGLEGDFRFFLT
jgi:hypothetical protein